MVARLAALVAAAGVTGCASTDDGPITVPSATTTAAIGPAGEEALQRQLSVATVEVGDRVFKFAATCYAPGAGDLLVLGVAEDPESDDSVELYLQAFIADPYIGLRLSDGTLIESALDGPLDIYFQDDAIRVSAVRFVQNLDLGTGEGEDVGLGELEVFCSDYLRELPS